MDKLTKKQQGFVKDYIETENATEAIVNNYDVKDRIVAKSMGSENLAKPYIKEIIESIADSLPNEDLIKVHKEGLKAITGKGDDVQPDYSVRHKYLDSAYKLKGSYAADKVINLNVEAEITNSKARELAEKYEQELKKNL